MSYENIDLSGFWRGSEKQIPESRKRLLRRGVELDYINTLTKPERRGLFSAGHTFVNAEREANGQAPYYPRSSASFPRCEMVLELTILFVDPSRLFAKIPGRREATSGRRVGRGYYKHRRQYACWYRYSRRVHAHQRTIILLSAARSFWYNSIFEKLYRVQSTVNSGNASQNRASLGKRGCRFFVFVTTFSCDV